MFERVIEAAEGRVRASAALAPAFRGSEAAFWTAVAANLRRAETDAGRPKCRSAGKTTYRSESVARVAAQHGAEQDHGSRVWNAYPCAACAGWHVGHGWSTRVSDARPLTDGYEYGERLDVTFAVSGESAIDGRCYRDQLRAALCKYGVIADRLVAAGVLRREIAFIHDAASDEDRNALFAAANAGTIRVLIGSTQKMGTGVFQSLRKVLSFPRLY